MSSQPPNTGGGNQIARGATNGAVNGSVAMPTPSRSTEGQLGGTGGTGGTNGNMSQQNLNSINMESPDSSQVQQVPVSPNGGKAPQHPTITRSRRLQRTATDDPGDRQIASMTTEEQFQAVVSQAKAESDEMSRLVSQSEQIVNESSAQAATMTSPSSSDTLNVKSSEITVGGTEEEVKTSEVPATMNKPSSAAAAASGDASDMPPRRSIEYDRFGSAPQSATMTSQASRPVPLVDFSISLPIRSSPQPFTAVPSSHGFMGFTPRFSQEMPRPIHMQDSNLFAGLPVPPGYKRAWLSDEDEPVIPRRDSNPNLARLENLVIEYLSKKGYTRTEATLRAESANQDADGRPIQSRAEDAGGARYSKAFELARLWIEDSLEIYKPELRRVLWPIFVYSFLSTVSEGYSDEASKFFTNFKGPFEEEHAVDLGVLQSISLPEHVLENHVAILYRENKYRLTLSSMAFLTFMQFLESHLKEGGTIIATILSTYFNVITVDRAADDQHSLAAMLGRARTTEDFPGEDEGIPGHNPGSANVDRNATAVLTRLKLGPLPMETELIEDIHYDLIEHDEANPPGPGQKSLVQEFHDHIKREESDDAPNRNDLPIPKAMARDVLMEIQKVKENRDRFKIEGRTGGVGPQISVCMFTFHNTHESINCLEISQDNLLIAAGMAESYIRVWSLDGKALPSRIKDQPLSNSRRLIGHSAPVYGLSFSPSGSPSESHSSIEKSQLRSRFLLSCSSDNHIRLWSLDAWTCVVIYKGHDQPVWDITWGPFGHYFASCSLDKTARLWATSSASYIRILVGHDDSVACICFHPNSAYVFTASDDKQVRMWALSNGYPVRMFTGHTGHITTIECSPNGKILATADDVGIIILWDLGPGKLLKRMRGHGKGGIWSLAWSMESTVVISGGADGTVRVWDVEGPADAAGQGKIIGDGAVGQRIDGGNQPAATASNLGPGGKKKGKEVIITPDQISAFPTKKSTVYKVRFTNMNLALAGGAFLPEVPR